MYDGTLAEDWRALITFQQMIVLCDPDGVVDMTPSSLSRRTGIPIEHIKAGVEILEKEDACSRTPDEKGCRIIRLDEHRAWGWKIVNHKKYKELTDYESIKKQNRERQQRCRENKKGHVSHVTLCDSNAKSRHTDTDTDTDTDNTPNGVFVDETSTALPEDNKIPPCPHKMIVELWNTKMPGLPQVRFKHWGGTRKKHLTARWREDVERQCEQWWGGFFDYICSVDFLMGRKGDFQLSLGWVLKAENIIKILEGNYD